MRRMFIVLTALVLAWPICAQDDHDVTLSIDPASVTIGEIFRATVEFTLPADATPQVPGEEADFGGAEVRSVEQRETVLEKGAKRHTADYSLTLWEVGESTLTSPAIAYRTAEGQVRELERVQKTVTVQSVLPEGAEEIRDIRGPKEVPLRWYHYVLAALPVIALLGLLALLVWWMRSRRHAEEAEEVPVSLLSPAEEALTALQELEDEDLVGQGLIKEHYVKLSWILRNYAERRWHVPALEETSGMLRHTMLGSGRVSEFTVEQVTAVLLRADLAKFAKHRPEVGTARADIDEAREIVHTTRPRQEVAEDAAPDVAIASSTN